MELILALNILIVLVTVGFGIYYIVKKNEKSRKLLKKMLRVNVFTFIPLMLIAMALLVPDAVFAMTDTTTTAVAENSSAGLGYIAAALATGLATIGTGYAVGAVGSSALGAVSEDPKILGKTLIFVGLAEGIAIYGLIISILIIGRL
ncbi:MAG: ATPase [Clostridiales bacterium]|nr:ATPase [Clostridiales bacterium]